MLSVRQLNILMFTRSCHTTVRRGGHSVHGYYQSLSAHTCCRKRLYSAPQLPGGLVPLLKSLPPASIRTTCVLPRPHQQAAQGNPSGQELAQHSNADLGRILEKPSMLAW